MHKNIVSHNEDINSSNINPITEMNFIFLCLDKSEIKELIISNLESFKIPFIDVGMGIEVVDDMLIGILRVTSSTEGKRDHIRRNNRISFSDNDGEDIYSKNIQIAELNAFNAALAVIKWKKISGFYQDLENEYFCTYTINVNMLLNEDTDP